MGAGNQEATMRLEGWNFESHTQPPGRGGRLEVVQSPVASDLLNRACLIEPPEKPEGRRPEGSRWMNTWRCWEGAHLERVHTWRRRTPGEGAHLERVPTWRGWHTWRGRTPGEDIPEEDTPGEGAHLQRAHLERA